MIFLTYIIDRNKTFKNFCLFIVNKVVKKALEEVGLAYSAKVRAGSYSGGMRRRLSVASALLGDPKLVILDEPVSTNSYQGPLESGENFLVRSCIGHGRVTCITITQK